MATVRKYGYYVKGNKVAIVERDTSFDNDPDNKDYGPGTTRSKWTSPLATVANGLEIEYAYSPKYIINDLDDTKAITAYTESSGLLSMTVASMSATADDWLLIRGSDRWNGLHQVSATISGQTTIVFKTKYNGGAVTESSTLYQDIDILNDESDEIPVPEYLSKALVYYVKAKFMEDMGKLEEREYFLREFRRAVEKHESSKVWGARVIGPGMNAIR